MLVGGGVNQHMENSICFVVFIFESFPNVCLIVVSKLMTKWHSLPTERFLHILVLTDWPSVLGCQHFCRSLIKSQPQTSTFLFSVSRIIYNRYLYFNMKLALFRKWICVSLFFNWWNKSWGRRIKVNMEVDEEVLMDQALP